jgi:hypothetical protein
VRRADTVDLSYYKTPDKTGHSYQTDLLILSDARAAFAGVAPTDGSRKLTITTRDRGQYYELRSTETESAAARTIERLLAKD